jgi:hypothetical protein
MGEYKATVWELVRSYLCWLLGHAFEYEPMEGDVPPHEFHYCALCGKSNPTFK